MGLFDKIFKRPPPGGVNNAAWWEPLTAYAPVFTSWSGNLYEAMQVRAAIHARATHISKLSVTVEGAAQRKLQTRLRIAPNEFMEWSQFLYRLSTILDMQNTAFIVPVQNYYGEPEGIYPILPSRCEIVTHGGEPWLRYQFSNGQTAAVEMRKCGIMTKFQYQDDFFGASNNALNSTMELISIQEQGISAAVKNSNTFQFMARSTNWANDADIAKERNRFTKENIRGSDSPVLLFPNTYNDIRQIETKPFVADPDQMALINQNVYNYFGVNEDILQNKATGDQWSAFDDGVTEPFAIQFDSVVSKMIFSDLERGYGNKVVSTIDRLQYMTFREKREFATQMADRGALNRDEVRALFGKPALPNDQGKTYTIRGEYYLLGEDGSVTKKGDVSQNGAEPQQNPGKAPE